MTTQIDQSGKVEDTHSDTALAIANGFEYTILIPVRVKRSVWLLLRAERTLSKNITVMVFTACVYLLLRPHWHRIASFTIDLEYFGKDAEICGYLLYLCKRDGVKLPKSNIQFGQVGKHANAHHIALSVSRGERKPDKVVTLEELIVVLGIAKRRVEQRK